MIYSQQGVIQDTRPWTKMFVAGAAAVTLAAGLFVSANAVTVAGCDFDDSTAGTWSLTGDCTTTGPINVPANTVLEGNGHTISAGYTFGSNGDGTNTVIGIVNADNVSVNDLTIEGTGGTSLHGVNVYVSNNVSLNNVTSQNNDKYGVVVNGSSVTVNNLTTAGNGWGGVNVSQGGGVTNPAVLTVNGISNHSDVAHIYLDNTQQNVSVVDTNSQYNVSQPVTNPDRPNDRLYTLKNRAEVLGDCKNGAWMSSVREDSSTFKNQGQCVAYVQSSANSKHHRQ